MELSKNEKLKNSINEFVAALREFAEWVDADNAPVEELVDKEDIRKAFEEHRSNFSVPILTWEILHMAWLNKTGFWYDDAFIGTMETGNILKCGFEVSEPDGTVIEVYEFGDFFDEENVCMDWETLTEVITDDLQERNKDVPF